MLRKFLSISLIAVFLFNLFGYYPLFRLVQNSIKSEISNKINKGIKSHDLVAFSIPMNRKDQLKWLNSHEFAMNGIYYDVVSTYVVGDVLNIVCYPDKKESGLVFKYEKTSKEQNSQSSPFGKNVLNFLKKTVHDLYYSEFTPDIISSICCNSFSSPDSYLPERIIEDINPPPRA